MDICTGFLVGLCGAFVYELLKFVAIRQDYFKDPGKYGWVKSKMYYFGATVYILVGGATAAFYVWTDKLDNKQLALHVGISAPVLLAGLGAAAPNLTKTS